MSVVDHLRREAAELRRLADEQSDAELRGELLALAQRCEQLAIHMSSNGNAGHPEPASD